jgi:hypothetical protein
MFAPQTTAGPKAGTRRHPAIGSIAAASSVARISSHLWETCAGIGGVTELLQLSDS